MRTITLPLPVFGFIVATRAALAGGLGLLFAYRLPLRQRRSLGMALVGIGAVATIPAVWWLSQSLHARRNSSPTGTDRRLVGATRFPRKGDDPF